MFFNELCLFTLIFIFKSATDANIRDVMILHVEFRLRHCLFLH